MSQSRKPKPLYNYLEEKKRPEEKSPRQPKIDRLSTQYNDFLSYSLFGFLSTSSAYQLAKTNRRFKLLPKYKEASVEFQKNLNQLLWFVANGKKYEAELLLNSIDDAELLLLSSGKATYATQKYEGTALQTALAVEDVDIYDDKDRKVADGMAEMIQRHLRKLPNGEEIIKEQILSRFPEGWEETEKQRHEVDVKALKKIRAAITGSKSDNDPELIAALAEFRNHIIPKGVIRTGKYWNANLLSAALEMGYEKYYYDWRKDDFFYNKVVGLIQSLAPANYAMAQAGGLKSLLEEGVKLTRSLKYHYGTGACRPYSGRLANADWGSGFWVDCYFGGRCGWRGGAAARGFKTMSEQKQNRCSDLCRGVRINRSFGV